MRHKRLKVALLVLLAAGAGVGGYFLWRPRLPVIPNIPTEGMDAQVVAAIDGARADVAGRPQSAAAWGHFGMVLFAHDLYQFCPEVLAEAERLDPSDRRWPYFRGLALILHKPEEGIAALQRAAGVPPPAFAARLRLAEEYVKLDRLDEADAIFCELLAEEPNNPRASLGHGQILSRRGSLQEALAPLEAAAEHPTARRSARVALAETYLRLGNSTAAEAERKRIAEGPSDQAWPDPFLAEAHKLMTGLQPRLSRVSELRASGQIDEAAALMSELLRDHPYSDEAHLTMAKVQIRAGHMDLATHELRRAIALNPNLLEAQFLLGGTLVVRKEYAAAEQAYVRTLALKPMHGPAHYMLGDCRLKQGNKAGALAAFRDAVRCGPELVEANLELGALLLQDGKVEEAMTWLDKALRLDSGNDRARTLLEQARAKAKAGNWLKHIQFWW
jgi:tetratricopeptide (TPR) repeat protein